MDAVEFGTFVNNGMIEIPVEYRKDFSTNIRVILLKDKSNQETNESDIQERIAAAERLVGIGSKEAMTLEDIRNERLARQ
jgi:negative regulator of genetic competence, sporulation and motility